MGQRQVSPVGFLISPSQVLNFWFIKRTCSKTKVGKIEVNFRLPDAYYSSVYSCLCLPQVHSWAPHTHRGTHTCTHKPTHHISHNSSLSIPTFL